MNKNLQEKLKTYLYRDANPKDIFLVTTLFRVSTSSSVPLILTSAAYPSSSLIPPLTTLIPAADPSSSLHPPLTIPQPPYQFSKSKEVNEKKTAR